MKFPFKISLTIIAVLCAALSLSAQPRSVGALVGATGAKLSYQHRISAEQFVSIDAGVDLGYNVSGHPGAKVTGTYNFIWAKPKWTRQGSWSIYAGPGLSAGWVQDRVVVKTGEERANSFADGFVVGVVGQVGLEYCFEIPFSLALEIRPCIGLHMTDRTVSFYDNGFLGFIPSLAIRYPF